LPNVQGQEALAPHWVFGCALSERFRDAREALSDAEEHKVWIFSSLAKAAEPTSAPTTGSDAKFRSLAGT
jgi:hypothetical protein